MRIALRKVWRDLWRNKGRTLLIVLSIAIGVLALGMTGGSNTLLKEAMTTAHAESNPSNALLYLGGFVDEATINSLSRIEGITGIEGYAEVGIRWKANLEDDWEDGNFIVLRDYQSQGYDQLQLQQGAWPNGRLVGVENNHIAGMGAPGYGETVYFDINERARPVTVGGVVRDPFQFPPPFGFSAAFYGDQYSLNEIAGISGFNRLRLTVDDYSEELIYDLADAIDLKLKKLGATVVYIEPLPPNQHFLQEMMDGVGVVLTVMAFASLGLSTILVINTLNAVIAQQVPQIGIMKAIGGVRGQIAAIYMANVIIYGVLALLVAVPLGALGGAVMSNWILSAINVPSADFVILPEVLIVQILMGLLTPLLAALYPVLKGVAIEVATALNQQGLGRGQYGTRWLDQMLGRVRGLPRMLTMAMRNTFRRPGRVLMTLVTLVASGMIFMMVQSTQYSFLYTIDKVYASFGYEVMVGFEQYQRIDEIVPLVETLPDVDFAEIWIFSIAETWVPGTTDSKDRYEMDLRGVPRDTRLFSPELISGRHLHSEDQHALLLNQKVAGKMGVQPGDQIVIEFLDGVESTWTVVGLVLDMSGRDQSTAYVYYDVLSKEMNIVGQGAIIELSNFEKTLAMQEQVARDVRTLLEERGYGISFVDTALAEREQISSQFKMLTNVLMVMTVLMGAVGSMGLSGTLSINVIERRREIGVMRAVGASSRDIGFIFSGEALALGLISWALAIPPSLLIGPTFVLALGDTIGFPAEYAVSTSGIWIWLAIVVVLSLVASWLPARRATRISVNESLAYE